MKHCRLDYEAIQPDPNADPPIHIADDEPVFIIRSKDIGGPDTVRAWCHINKYNGAAPALIDRVLRWADEMEVWAARNGGGKTPDTPTGLLRP